MTCQCKNLREQWKFLARETHWGYEFLIWELTANPSPRNELGKRYVKYVRSIR